MSKLSHIALVFAKECMGWGRAEVCSEVDKIRSKPNPYECDYFHFADLDEVTETVTVWCRKNGADFRLQWKSLAGLEGRFSACVHVHSKDEVRVCVSDSPSNVLMSACIEAARLYKKRAV